MRITTIHNIFQGQFTTKLHPRWQNRESTKLRASKKSPSKSRDMGEFEKQLKGKTRLLNFISVETNEVLKKKEKDAVTRQIGVYEKKVTEIYELKLSIQELKLAEGQDPGEIRAWTDETQAKIKEFDAVIAKLKDTLPEIH